MGGRKNHIQQLGVAPGKNLNDIADPFERDFQFRSMQASPFCKHCGEQILNSTEDSDGRQIDAEWEMKNLAHYRCHTDWKQETEMKAKREAEQKRVAAANFDWDTYMKDMLNKKED